MAEYVGLLSVPLSSYRFKIARSSYLARLHRVQREAEEDVVENEHLLLLGVHRIQRLDVLVDNRHRAPPRRLHEVEVDLVVRAVTLHPLEQRLLRQVLAHLELLVPVANASQVEPVEALARRALLILAIASCARVLSRVRREPLERWHRARRDQVRLGVEHVLQVLFESRSELAAQLVEQPSQRVREARVLAVRVRVEAAALDAVVHVESVSRAGDLVLSAADQFGLQVEQVALHSAQRRWRVERGERELVDARNGSELVRLLGEDVGERVSERSLLRLSDADWRLKIIITSLIYILSLLYCILYVFEEFFEFLCHFVLRVIWAFLRGFSLPTRLVALLRGSILQMLLQV